jgi:hypothetical protein
MTEKELDQMEMYERELQSVSDWMAKYYPCRIYKTETIDENTHEVSNENQVIICEYELKSERHICVLIQRLADGYICYQDGAYGFIYFPLVNPIKTRNSFEPLPPKI